MKPIERTAPSQGQPMQAQGSARSRDLEAFPDAELLPLALQTIAAAFRVIMQRHNRRLYRCARAIVRDDSEAEDVVQETYVNAFAKLAAFRGHSSLATWLTRIALNDALGRVRRRRRMAALNAANGAYHGTIITPAPAATNDDPERAAAHRHIRRLLERAIDELPEPFRVVFVMRDIEAMSSEATAAFLRLPAATAKTRLHRARRLLRRALAERLAEALVEAFPFNGRHRARMTGAVLHRLGFALLSAP